MACKSIGLRLCDDPDIVLRILINEKVRKFIGDDFTDTIKINPDWLYLVTDDDRGVVAVQPMNYVCYQLHIAIIPKIWGKAREIGRSAGLWLFKNTPCEKLQVIVPIFNKLAIKIAVNNGMQKEGVLKNSFSKGFKMHDQIIFGITKEEALCQQRQR